MKSYRGMTDLVSTMYILLNQLGKSFNLSHICILEKVPGKEEFHMVYLWNGKMQSMEENKSTTYLYKNWREEIKGFYQKGILNIPDCSKLKDGLQIRQFLEQIGAKAFLSCEIYDGSEITGCMTIDDCEKARIWTEEEIACMMALAQVISNYASKDKAIERTTKMVDNLINYDMLTGLPLLSKFKEETKKILVQNLDQKYAVVYLDISNFKYINDTYGYVEGDKILQAFADYINKHKDSFVYACRVVSDQFIVLSKMTDKDSLRWQIRHYSEDFVGTQKEDYPGSNLVIASGAYIVEDAMCDIVEAIDSSNIARKIAKKSLITDCMIFDEEMKTALQMEMKVLFTMKEALNNKEFLVYLQPKICLEDEKIVGAEALIRWKDAQGNIVPAYHFVPALEKSGFITEVDFYVYQEVCELIRRRIKEGKSIIPISVNVSRVHLKDNEFLDKIKKLHQNYHTEMAYLEFELTESIFSDEEDKAIKIMEELSQMGFKVSIDDFGSGYSSLNLLKKLTVDVLKLDKAFLSKEGINIKDGIVISSIIDMAKKLKIEVLCEGVETIEQVEFLKKTGCNLVQGYLFAKPMPIEELELRLDLK